MAMPAVDWHILSQEHGRPIKASPLNSLTCLEPLPDSAKLGEAAAAVHDAGRRSQVALGTVSGERGRRDCPHPPWLPAAKLRGTTDRRGGFPRIWSLSTARR